MAWEVDEMPYYKAILSPLARSLRGAWNSHRYRGTGVTCPVCERSFRGYIGSPLGNCAGCGAPSRARLMWLFLEGDGAKLLKQSTSLLQIAPDTGLESRFRK